MNFYAISWYPKEDTYKVAPYLGKSPLNPVLEYIPEFGKYEISLGAERPYIALQRAEMIFKSGEDLKL